MNGFRFASWMVASVMAFSTAACTAGDETAPVTGSDDADLVENEGADPEHQPIAEEATPGATGTGPSTGVGGTPVVDEDGEGEGGAAPVGGAEGEGGGAETEPVPPVDPSDVPGGDSVVDQCLQTFDVVGCIELVCQMQFNQAELAYAQTEFRAMTGDFQAMGDLQQVETCLVFADFVDATFGQSVTIDLGNAALYDCLEDAAAGENALAAKLLDTAECAALASGGAVGACDVGLAAGDAGCGDFDLDGLDDCGGLGAEGGCGDFDLDGLDDCTGLGAGGCGDFDFDGLPDCG